MLWYNIHRKLLTLYSISYRNSRRDCRNLPDLIKAAVDVIMSFFSGIVDALKGIDTDTLLQGIVGIGLLTAIMAALSTVAALVPGAMGCVRYGSSHHQVGLGLAAIGALHKYQVWSGLSTKAEIYFKVLVRQSVSLLAVSSAAL